MDPLYPETFIASPPFKSFASPAFASGTAFNSRFDKLVPTLKPNSLSEFPSFGNSSNLPRTSSPIFNGKERFEDDNEPVYEQFLPSTTAAQPNLSYPSTATQPTSTNYTLPPSQNVGMPQLQVPQTQSTGLQPTNVAGSAGTTATASYGVGTAQPIPQTQGVQGMQGVQSTQAAQNMYTVPPPAPMVPKLPDSLSMLNNLGSSISSMDAPKIEMFVEPYDRNLKHASL